MEEEDCPEAIAAGHFEAILIENFKKDFHEYSAFLEIETEQTIFFSVSKAVKKRCDA